MASGQLCREVTLVSSHRLQHMLDWSTLLSRHPRLWRAAAGAQGLFTGELCAVRVHTLRRPNMPSPAQQKDKMFARVYGWDARDFVD